MIRMITTALVFTVLSTGCTTNQPSYSRTVSIDAKDANGCGEYESRCKAEAELRALSDRAKTPEERRIESLNGLEREAEEQALAVRYLEEIRVIREKPMAELSMADMRRMKVLDSQIKNLRSHNLYNGRSADHLSNDVLISKMSEK